MIIKLCHVLVLLVFYVDLVDKKSLYDVGICDWKLIGDN